MVEVSNIVDALTSITDLYGEDPLITALVPALMVGILMLGAIGRIWE
jgi:hypothetical protein